MYRHMQPRLLYRHKYSFILVYVRTKLTLHDAQGQVFDPSQIVYTLYQYIEASRWLKVGAAAFDQRLENELVLDAAKVTYSI